VLDGSFMTQELNFTMHSSESSLTSEPLAAASASIADPYVLLKMVDGTVRLLVGGMVYVYPLVGLFFFHATLLCIRRIHTPVLT